MERGDISFVSLDPTTGHEHQGRRPVLVISPEAFNRVTRVPVVLPITAGGGFARTAPDGCRHVDDRCRPLRPPRALDLQARGGRRVERVPQFIVDEVLARLAPIVQGADRRIEDDPMRTVRA